MKTCPNCKSEIEDNWDICWNCNYSMIENKVIQFKETTKVSREIECLRCKIPLIFSGEYKFHEGAHIGFFGNLFEAFVNREKFDLYICPTCEKVEFYMPQKG